MGLLNKANHVKRPAEGGLLRNSKKLRTSLPGEKSRSGEMLAEFHRQILPRTELSPRKDKKAPLLPPHPGSIDEYLQDLTRDYYSKIETIRGEAEYIDFITSLFARHLGITRLTTLVYSPLDDRYQVWSGMGFSPETNEKLNFSITETAALFKEKDAFFVSRGELSLMAEHFSPQDFSHLQNLLLLPFTQEENPPAFLLIANLEEEFIDHQGLCHYLFRIQNSIHTRLFAEREKNNRKIKEKDFRTVEWLYSQLKKQKEDAEVKEVPFSLIKLSLPEAIAAVKLASPQINLILLQEEIIKVISQLWQTAGNLYNMKNGILLLGISTMKRPDLEILQIHLEKSLNSYLKSLLKRNLIQVQLKSFPLPGEKGYQQTLARLL